MAPIHNTIGDTSNGDDVRGGDGSGVGGGELMSEVKGGDCLCDEDCCVDNY